MSIASITKKIHFATDPIFDNTNKWRITMQNSPSYLSNRNEIIFPGEIVEFIDQEKFLGGFFTFVANLDNDRCYIENEALIISCQKKHLSKVTPAIFAGKVTGIL